MHIYVYISIFIPLYIDEVYPIGGGGGVGAGEYRYAYFKKVGTLHSTFNVSQDSVEWVLHPVQSETMFIFEKSLHTCMIVDMGQGTLTYMLDLIDGMQHYLHYLQHYFIQHSTLRFMIVWKEVRTHALELSCVTWKCRHTCMCTQRCIRTGMRHTEVSCVFHHPLTVCMQHFTWSVAMISKNVKYAHMS